MEKILTSRAHNCALGEIIEADTKILESPVVGFSNDDAACYWLEFLRFKEVDNPVQWVSECTRLTCETPGVWECEYMLGSGREDNLIFGGLVHVSCWLGEELGLAQCGRISKWGSLHHDRFDCSLRSAMGSISMHDSNEMRTKDKNIRWRSWVYSTVGVLGKL